jgi:hypothetical protein
MSNPFFHRGPIRDPAYFYGRRHELGQVMSLLGAAQSVSLVAQRRIGKTSFLFHIAQPQVCSGYGLDPDQHLFVYVDCGGLGGLDQPGIYRVLLEEIGDVLLDRGLPAGQLETLDDAQPITYRAFERTLRGLARVGWKLIFLLDEFERMSRNPHLDPDFFSGLRALAARYPLAYVVASKQPLLELTYADASTLSSPFFNIFASVRLGLFSEAEARDLLSGLAGHGGTSFTPATTDFILDLAGPHPLFVQIAGFHAFELGQAGAAPLTQADYLELRRRFLASAEEHYVYYWRSLTPSEQHVLATLPALQAERLDPARRDYRVMHRLEQACLIVPRAGGYDYLSSAWRAFVEAQPLSGLLQAGPLSIDAGQRQAWLHGQPLTLTSTQYTLMVHLAEHAGQVVAGEDLEKAVWGEAYVEDPERLKSVIKGLRRALGEEAARLENVRGVGYVWRA